MVSSHHRSNQRKFKELTFGVMVGIVLGILTLDRDLYRFGEGIKRISFRIRPHVYTQTNHTRSYHILNTSESLNISQTSITVAEKLAKKIRILCWVLTSPQNHIKRALLVKNTWGKHCNILLFMSSVEDPTIDSIALNITAGRKYLWGKTKLAIKYVYEHYLHKADWFLKADDDTFVIVENLRYFLKNKNTRIPIYYGCRFKTFIKMGYMSGGAGYVMSRAAVRRFVEFGLFANLGRLCRQAQFGAEDAELGKCMQAIGVRAGDSVDVGLQYKFNPFSPDSHLTRNSHHRPAWYDKYTWWRQPKGLKCCSDSAISFHYIRGDMMTSMYYFLYNLRIDETYSANGSNLIRKINSSS